QEESRERTLDLLRDLDNFDSLKRLAHGCETPAPKYVLRRSGRIITLFCAALQVRGALHSTPDRRPSLRDSDRRLVRLTTDALWHSPTPPLNSAAWSPASTNFPTSSATSTWNVPGKSNTRPPSCAKSGAAITRVRSLASSISRAATRRTGRFSRATESRRSASTTRLRCSRRDAPNPAASIRSAST